MSVSLLPDAALLAALDPIFASEGDDTVYWRHLGIGEDTDGETDDLYEKTSMRALPTRNKVWKTMAATKMFVQTEDQAYMFRKRELPAGVDVKNLTANDYVVIGNAKYKAVSFRDIGPFFRVETKGA